MQTGGQCVSFCPVADLTQFDQSNLFLIEFSALEAKKIGGLLWMYASK